MKILSALLISIFSFGSLAAMPEISVTILDSDSEEGLPFATVKSRLVSDSHWKVFTTNDKGIADLTSQSHWLNQPVVLEVTYIGFNAYTDTVTFTPNTIVNLTWTTNHLHEHVVTGQSSRTTVEKAVQKVQVITAKDIQEMQAITLDDALKFSSNIRLEQDNVLGTGISMQGLSGQNVKILIDGVPVVGRLNGNVDLSQINLDHVERIEIIEGPLSVQYGSNALAGTINIITKKGKNSGSGATVNTYLESVGQTNINASISHPLKNDWQLNLSGGRNVFHGWSEGDEPFSFLQKTHADTNRTDEWKPKVQNFASAGLSRQFSNLSLFYTFSYFDEMLLIRGAPKAPYFETAIDEKIYTERLDNAVSLDWKINDNWNFNSVNSYNIYNRNSQTEVIDLTTMQTSESENSASDDQFTQLLSRSSFVNQSNKKAIYSLGYEFTRQTAAGVRIEDEFQDQMEVGLYGTAEFQWGKKWLIKPGVRWNWNSAYDAPIIPSLNIRYKGKHLTHRVSAGKGYRAPSLKELYFDFVDVNHDITGNRDLLAESSWNAGYYGEWNHTGDKAIFRVNYGLYYNHVKDQITLVQTGDVSYKYDNVSEVQTQGGNVQFNYFRKYLNVSLGTGLVGQANSLTDNDFKYYPELFGNAQFTERHSKLVLNVYFKYQGARQNFYENAEGEVDVNELGSYTMLDVLINRNVWKDRLTLTTGVKNLLNVTQVNSTNGASGAHEAAGGSYPVSTGVNYIFSLQFNL